ERGVRSLVANMTGRILVLVAIASVTATCAEPKEVLQPPEWVSTTLKPPDTTPIFAEPELVMGYVATDESSADVLLEIVVQGPVKGQSSQHTIAMKRALTRKGALLPSINVIGDGFDPDGLLAGARHVSIDVLNATEDKVVFAVELWWSGREMGS